jgi:N-acetyltransferase
VADPATLAFVRPAPLRDAGVALVPLGPEHAAGLAAAAAEEELWRLRVTWVPRPEEAEDYVATALATADRVPFAVLDEEDGSRVVGTSSFHDVLPGPRRVEIGHTWYAASRQRTALNTRCKLLLLEHAFGVVGCRTVGWRTDRENERSQRAIARLGARRDGVLRGQALRRDGSLRDTAFFSMTAAEWPAARERLTARLATGSSEVGTASDA